MQVHGPWRLTGLGVILTISQLLRQGHGHSQSEGRDGAGAKSSVLGCGKASES